MRPCNQIGDDKMLRKFCPNAGLFLKELQSEYFVHSFTSEALANLLACNFRNIKTMITALTKANQFII